MGANSRCKPVADAMIEDTTLSAEERNRIASSLVLGIAAFCDENTLYLNEEVTVHCCTVYIGIEDMAMFSSEAQRESAMADLRENYRKAREIIRAETGLKRLDSLFSKVTKAKYSSAGIRYYRELKKHKDHPNHKSPPPPKMSS
jgi:hypothetical protein